MEWVKRYLPAEVISTAVTVLSAWFIKQQGGSALTIALVGTWTGNITYFGYIIAADIRRSIAVQKQQHLPYTKRNLATDLRGVFVEFGLAEILDSLLIRPAMMYFVPRIVPGFTAGIIAAKLAADLLFYVPAIIGYEVNKKYLKEKSATTPN
ncbi:hypothetical protein [Mucilaginibacter antarcticus]